MFILAPPPGPAGAPPGPVAPPGAVAVPPGAMGLLPPSQPHQPPQPPDLPSECCLLSLKLSTQFFQRLIIPTLLQVIYFLFRHTLNTDTQY